MVGAAVAEEILDAKDVGEGVDWRCSRRMTLARVPVLIGQCQLAVVSCERQKSRHCCRTCQSTVHHGVDERS